MIANKLRRASKKTAKHRPPKPLARQLADAQKTIASGKAVNWRKVRSDV